MHGERKYRWRGCSFSIPRTEFKYFDSDTVALISALSNRDESFDLDLLPDDKKGFNEQDEVLRLVHDARADKPGFEPKVIKNDLKRVVCVQPKLSNKRIARQDGAFFCSKLMGKKEIAQLYQANGLLAG